MIKLLCTDMDRTLLPNGDASESGAAAECLTRLLRTASPRLAYVTGRDIGRVLDAISTFGVPVPDFIIGDVGSSLYRREGNAWVGMAEWQAHISEAWQGRDGEAVHALIGSDSRLVSQEPDRQSACKRSYYLERDEDHAALSNDLSAMLTNAGFDSALVISDDPERQCGLLDVLPAGATKRHGIEFLRDHLELSDRDVLFAGDSGNDLDALVSAFPAVLVANAEDEVRHAAAEGAQAQGNSALLYLARGGLELPGAGTLNGNYRAGIVEGLLHYHPTLRDAFHPAR